MTNIPEEVQRILRQEVGLCCPVPGCNRPYLTYHHFDPPRRIREHNEPEGMVALCHIHHDQADGGAYTNDQLRLFKTTGRRAPEITETINWRRETTLIVAGGSFYMDTPILLMARGQKIIWLTKDEEGYDLINFDIRSPEGDPIFTMLNNSWAVTPVADDLIAPPQTRSLEVRSNETGTYLNLRFFSEPRAQIEQRYRGEPTRVLDVAGVSQDAELLTCEITANIMWPVPVALSPKETRLPGMTLATMSGYRGQCAIMIV